MSEIKLSYVSIKYNAPIVHFIYDKDIELGFPEMRELISWAEKLSDKKPYFTLSDVREHIKITNEGKKVIEDLGNMPLFRGSAVLVKNSLYKFAVNFLSYFNKQKYPFRAFTSEEAAIKWLLSLPLD